MRHSVRIAVGPVQFRIGSDWAGPVAALERLYAAYPQDDMRPADATVRLFDNAGHLVLDEARAAVDAIAAF